MRLAELLIECRLSDFVELVIHYGTPHGLLLDTDVVLAELDDDDHAELMREDWQGRQVWAELLAHRLCAAEPSPIEDKFS